MGKSSEGNGVSTVILCKQRAYINAKNSICSDKFRERIFILTIAAEEGWKIASEVSFQKKGNAADKDLAKVRPDIIRLNKLGGLLNYSCRFSSAKRREIKRAERRLEAALRGKRNLSNQVTDLISSTVHGAANP